MLGGLAGSGRTLGVVRRRAGGVLATRAARRSLEATEVADNGVRGAAA
jgi:hypothetical protein